MKLIPLPLRGGVWRKHVSRILPFSLRALAAPKDNHLLACGEIPPHHRSDGPPDPSECTIRPRDDLVREEEGQKEFANKLDRKVWYSFSLPVTVQPSGTSHSGIFWSSPVVGKWSEKARQKVDSFLILLPPECITVAVAIAVAAVVRWVHGREQSKPVEGKETNFVDKPPRVGFKRCQERDVWQVTSWKSAKREQGKNPEEKFIIHELIRKKSSSSEHGFHQVAAKAEGVPFLEDSAGRGSSSRRHRCHPPGCIVFQ